MRTIKKGDAVSVVIRGESRVLQAASDERERHGMRSFEFVAYDGGYPPYPISTAFLCAGRPPERGGLAISEILEITQKS